jgi:hypothetical protein
MIPSVTIAAPDPNRSKHGCSWVRRTRSLLLRLPCVAALLACSGCFTTELWHSEGAWPPAVNRVTAIDAATFSADEQLYLRLSHRSPWRKDFRTVHAPSALSSQWLDVVPADEWPPTSLPVHILEWGGMRALLDANPDVAHHDLPPALWIELDVVANPPDAVWILDSRNNLRWQRVELPTSGLAWTSPNIAGHIATTPLALAADVVFVPVAFIAVGILLACGVHLGH